MVRCQSPIGNSNIQQGNWKKKNKKTKKHLVSEVHIDLGVNWLMVGEIWRTDYRKSWGKKQIKGWWFKQANPSKIVPHKPSLVSRIRVDSPCIAVLPLSWLGYLDWDHWEVTKNYT
jgi:hypothetical protein